VLAYMTLFAFSGCHPCLVICVCLVCICLITFFALNGETEDNPQINSDNQDKKGVSRKPAEVHIAWFRAL